MLQGLRKLFAKKEGPDLEAEVARVVSRAVHMEGDLSSTTRLVLLSDRKPIIDSCDAERSAGGMHRLREKYVRGPLKASLVADIGVENR